MTSAFFPARASVMCSLLASFGSLLACSDGSDEGRMRDIDPSSERVDGGSDARTPEASVDGAFDAAPLDASEAAAPSNEAAVDAAPHDAEPDAPASPAPCETNPAVLCDDGNACNGEEACLPRSPSADTRGCALAKPAVTCTTGQACDPRTGVCSVCLVAPDQDGDKSASMTCGGRDCDDADGNNYPGNLEVCDGKDNNCDGAADEGLCGAACGQTLPNPPGTACVVGLGECVRHGTYQCAGQGTSCSATPSEPKAELCDKLDNDCDGVVDDGLANACGGACDQELMHEPGASCTTGVGMCERAGRWVCSATSVRCDAVAGEPGVELCDQTDNDCDGLIDEGDVCPLPCVPSPEVCDGIDNDCDDAIDEGVITRWYGDCDKDGYARYVTDYQDACQKPADDAYGCGWTSVLPDAFNFVNWDCADFDDRYHPGAEHQLPSVGGSRDFNCDGVLEPQPTWTPSRHPVCSQEILSSILTAAPCPVSAGSCRVWWSGSHYQGTWALKPDKFCPDVAYLFEGSATGPCSIIGSVEGEWPCK